MVFILGDFLDCLCREDRAYLVCNAHRLVHGHDALADEVATIRRTAEAHLVAVEVNAACHVARHSDVNPLFSVCQWHFLAPFLECDTILPYRGLCVNGNLGRGARYRKRTFPHGLHAAQRIRKAGCHRQFSVCGYALGIARCPINGTGCNKARHRCDPLTLSHILE